MSAPQWMPLYIADYLRDTSHLRAAESGAYLHLIMAYWVGGRLPNDDRQLATIAKMTMPQWLRTRPLLEPFFGSDFSSHKRIDRELAHAQDVMRQRKVAGLRGSEKASLARMLQMGKALKSLGAGSANGTPHGTPSGSAKGSRAGHQSPSKYITSSEYDSAREGEPEETESVTAMRSRLSKRGY